MFNDIYKAPVRIASFKNYFYIHYLIWCSKPLCEAERSMVTTKRNLISLKQRYFMKSGDRSSDSGHLLGHTPLPSPSLLHTRGHRAGDLRSLRVWLSFHEPPLWGLCFLRETLSTNQQRSWTWYLTEKIERKGHPWGVWVGWTASYLSVSHLSFSSWLCSDAENKNKRMRGWDSFLSLFSLGNSDIYYPRIMSLWENQAHFN